MNKAKYLAEKSTLDKTIEEYEENIRACKTNMEEESGDVAVISSEADAVCEAFKDAMELTYDMAHIFVDKIIVYRGDRIEIKWRFKDHTTDDVKENV